MIGLNKLDVVTIFKRHFKDQVVTDVLIKTIAMAVGEVIEENNKKIVDDLKRNNSISMNLWYINALESTLKLLWSIFQVESN